MHTITYVYMYVYIYIYILHTHTHTQTRKHTHMCGVCDTYVYTLADEGGHELGAEVS